MPEELKEMRVTNIDLVKSPANKRAILLYKAQKTEDLTKSDDGGAKTFTEVLQEEAIEEKLWDKIYALRESIASILKDNNETDKYGKVQQSLSEFLSYIFIQKSSNDKEKQPMADKDLTQLFKSFMEGLKKDDKQNTSNSDVDPQQVEIYKSFNEFLVNAQEIVKSEKVEDKEEAFKGLTESLVKSLKEQKVIKSKEEPKQEEVKVEDLFKSSKEYQELKKSNDELVKMVKAQQEAIEQQVYIAKAEKLSNVGEVGKLANILKSAKNSMTEEDYNEFETMLAKSNAVLEQASVFGEIGSSDGEAGSPKAELKKAVTELRKSNSNLTEAQATTEVLNSNPDLAAQLI